MESLKAKCYKCDAIVTSFAPECPNCGASFGKKKETLEIKIRFNFIKAMEWKFTHISPEAKIEYMENWSPGPTGMGGKKTADKVLDESNIEGEQRRLFESMLYKTWDNMSRRSQKLKMYMKGRDW